MTARHHKTAPNSTAMAVVALLAAHHLLIRCLGGRRCASAFQYGHLYLAQDQGVYAAKNLTVRRARSDDMKPACPLRSHILQSDARRWD